MNWFHVELLAQMTDRDNRFGLFKFGTSHKFGASSFDLPALAWDFSIDWDGDGLFETNESRYMKNIYIKRGRTRMIKNLGGGLESVSTGTATITLVNNNGRFDGWNEDSALYPNVGNGKTVRIRVRPLDGSILYPLFYGTISNIVPMGTRDKTVNIYVNDRLDFLRNATSRVAMQEGITPGEAIGLILDAAGWKAVWGRDLDTSVETIDYFWSSGSRKAISEIQDLANSFLGYFFCDARGRARFIDRTTVGDLAAEYSQDELLKDIGNPQPYEVKRDVTILKVHPRAQAATGVLWELIGTAPSVQTGANNPFTIFTPYTYANAPAPAVNVITPVATTDFLVNSQADGGGSNLTGSCTVTITDFGDNAKLVLTNTSGTLGYITKLQIRGDAIYETNAADVTYPTDLADAESLRELVFDLKWQQDFNVAVDIVSVLGPFYTALHPFPAIRLENRFEKQFGVDLFDIVSADLPKLGLIGESFRVGGIEHKSINVDNCQSIQTTLWLEPYIAAGDYMQWDTNSVWDTSTVHGW